MRYLFIAAALSILAAPGALAQSVEDLADDAVAIAEAPPAKAAEVDFVSAPFLTPATGAIVRGRSADRELRAWMRFVEDDTPGPWRDLHVVFSATGPTFTAGYHGEEVVSRGTFELRFSTADLTIEGAGIFDNRKDPDRIARARETTFDPPVANKRAGDVIAPNMISRADWGAEPFIGSPSPLAQPNYIYLTFHHAAGYGASTLEDGKQQLRAIQDLHQNARGWSDIGYQFIMDESGRIYQGRPFLDGPAPLSSAPALALGAHAGGANTGNIGICALGCYHPPAGSNCTDVLSEQSIDSLSVMLAFLSERYGVAPERLRGHRDFGSTACPGDNNYELLDDLQERIRLLLVTGNQPIGAAQLSAHSDEDGLVRLEWDFLEDNGIASYRIEREYGGESVVIYESSEPGGGELVDARTGLPGPVVYLLYARSTQGREQLLGIAEANVSNPAEYVLTENFPNPFSAATTVRYYLPQDGIVHLAVYDALGREVDVLVSGAQEGARWYHAEFDARSKPSGMYVYRLTVDGFSGTVFKESRSLLLVR